MCELGSKDSCDICGYGYKLTQSESDNTLYTCESICQTDEENTGE